MSIGQYDNEWRVSTTGYSGKLNFKGDTSATGKGLYGFKDDAEGAVAFAIADAIADGAIEGISASVAKALQSSDDLNEAITEALKVQEVETLMGGVGAELQKQFKAFEAQAKEDAKANAETDKIHAENGWVRTAESFADTYGEGYVRKDDPKAPSGFAPVAERPDNLGHNGGPPLNTDKDRKDERPASFAEHDADLVDQAVDELIVQDGFKVAETMTGSLVEKLLAADSEETARAILAEGLGAMDDAQLATALERASFAIRLDAENQSATTKENNA